MPASDADQLRTLRRSQWVCYLLIAAVVCSFGFYIYSYYRVQQLVSFAQYQQALATSLQENREELKAEALSLASELGGPMKEALEAANAIREGEVAEAFREQSREFLKEIGAAVEQAVQARYEKLEQRVLDSYLGGLQIPDRDAAEETLAATFDGMRTRMARRYHAEEIKEELGKSLKIWTSFTPVPAPGPEDAPLATQLVKSITYWTILTGVKAYRDQPATEAGQDE